MYYVSESSIGLSIFDNLSRTVFGDCRNLVKALGVCGNNLRAIEAKNTDQRGNMYMFVGIRKVMSKFSLGLSHKLKLRETDQNNIATITL